MLYDTSMLADFGVRLSFGLAVLLLATNWQSVPLPFFRTQCQVILGLLVLAALDGSRSEGLGPTVWILIAGAALAYMATIGWGLGLPRVAVPVTCLIPLATAGWLALASRSVSPVVWAFNTASRTASGFLLGATLTAMLLGHHYLTAPAMSIEPLKRFVRCMGWGLVARADRNHWHLSCPLRHPRPATKRGRYCSNAFPTDALGDGIRRTRPGDHPGLEDGADPFNPVGHGDSLCGHGPGAFR